MEEEEEETKAEPLKPVPEMEEDAEPRNSFNSKKHAASMVTPDKKHSQPKGSRQPMQRASIQRGAAMQ